MAKTNCILVFINQIRDKIGVMYGSSRNNDWRTRAEVLRERTYRYTQDRDAAPPTKIGNARAPES